MALINIKFASEVLGRQMEIQVIIPQKSTVGEIGIANNAKDEKYKTLLLLHGLSDDFTIWARRTSIDRYATEKGISILSQGYMQNQNGCQASPQPRLIFYTPHQ